MTQEELNEGDVFARINGIRLTAMNRLWAAAEMVVTESHLNGAGVCQGGAIFTLADLSQAGLTQGKALTIGSSIEFLHACKLGDHLRAVSKMDSDGKLPSVRTEVSLADGTLVAVVTGRLYRKEPIVK